MSSLMGLWPPPAGPDDGARYHADPDSSPAQVMARVLADPLRRAWNEHLARGCPRTCGAPGIAHCDVAWRLFRALPEGDRLTILGTVRG